MMVTGRQVIGIAVTAALATAVVPPAGAWWLNDRRVQQTADRLASSAEALSEADVALPSPTAILCGRGKRPDIPTETIRARMVDANVSLHESWLAAIASAADPIARHLEPDAWGRCLLLRITPSHTLLLSPGPNGIIETELDDESVGGDDIGSVVR